MSTKTTPTFDNTRRTFIKATAVTSALSMAGLSSLAFATKSPATLENSSDFISKDGIKVIQETQFDREKVTLINQSNKLQQLDAQQPVSLHQINGTLVVSLNQDAAKAVSGMIVMSPNERLTFDVRAVGLDVPHKIDLPVLTNIAENELKITSEHPVFNRIIPVQLA